MRRLLVLGLPRSGTTWTLGVLATLPGVRAVYEPDNVDAKRGEPGAGSRGYGPYPLVPPGAVIPHYATLWDLAFSGWIDGIPGAYRAGAIFLRVPRVARDAAMPLVASALRRRAGRLNRRRGNQVIAVKSVYALLAAEWLAQRYAPTVLVIERHPLNILSSWLEIGIQHWRLWERPDIGQALVEPLGLPPAPLRAEPLEQCAWTIGFLTEILGMTLARNPGWRSVSHEYLCVDTEARFRALFAELELGWSEATSAMLTASDRPGAGLKNLNRVRRDLPSRWRGRFTADELARAEAALEAFPRRGWVRPESAGQPLAG